MAIALRGSASVPSANPTTSFTVTVDAAVVAGDLLFLAVTSRDSVGAGTLAVTDNDTGGNSWTKIANSTDHKATLWYKRATSGTAGKTVTVSNAVGSASGVLKAFSAGSSGATPYSNVVVETNASADETHAGFTPGQADSMVCCAVFNYANDNAVTSLSFATLGATTATEKLSTGGSDCGCVFGHKIQTGAAAATGNLTWAQTDGTTYSITWAIKPQVAYTLACDAGAYVETGTAATLKATRTIAAAATSYAVTGTAETLRRGYPIIASAGAVVLTGASATVRVARALAMAAGVFAMVGTGASLTAQRALSSGYGSYALTGTDADLTYTPIVGYTLTADPGEFSMAGTAAAFARAYRLSSQGAAYTVAGSDVGLLAGSRLSADAGVFALNGTGSALLRGYAANAAAGFYSVAGTDAELDVSRGIVVSLGGFAWTGEDAVLTGPNAQYTLPAGPGAYAITGSAAALRRAIALIAEPQAFAITGAPATFWGERRLPADAGSVVWTGGSAMLRRDLPEGTIPCESGETWFDFDVALEPASYHFDV